MAQNKKPAQRSVMQEIRERANRRLGQWVRKKWRIDGLVGIGGMAAVYSATHRNGARVALKILHAEFARDENVNQRFLREGYVANKVKHPGVVSILDDDETDDGAAFLVMELLEGETLQQLWKRHDRRVPPAEALHILGAVLDTLIPFHEQNIIHRDLKPANIFITEEQVVKLLDFGVAQLRESGQAMTRAGTALGTPSYMSPEQAMGKSDALDGRSDVFAVGATLFAILSGKRLHHGRSDNEAFILAATQPAPSLARHAPELPVEVVGLVDKALQWDRRRRFDDAAQMRDACLALRARLRGDEPAVATPPSAPRSAPAAPATAADEVPEPEVAAAVVPAAMPQTKRPAGSPGAAPLHAVPEVLLTIFERLERSLPTLRQYGFDHPEGQARTRGVYRAAIDALRELQHGYSWSVYPYCFTFNDMSLWEPAAPHDRIPYLLTAAGVEEMTILPGITEEEMFTLLRIVIADPVGVGDGDIAAALWEARFEHIRLTIRDDFADADAAAQAKFYAEADDLETIAQEDLAEVAAMAVTTEAAAHELARRTSEALALDAAERAALQTQVSADMPRWQERHLHLLVDALHDAKQRDDMSIVLKPLARAAYRLAIRERHEELFATHRALLEGLANRYRETRFDGTSGILTGWMFPSQLLTQLSTRLAVSEGADPAHDDMMMQGLSRVFTALPGSMLGDMLTLADGLPVGGVQDLVLAFIDRSLEGNEEAAVALLDQLSPVSAQRTLAALAALSKNGNAAMLRPLLVSPNRAIRCEAMALLSDDADELGRQLLRMLEGSDGALRSSALATMVSHAVRSAGPGLVGLVERDDFGKRPAEEQEAMFETLFQLHTTRAQSLLTDILLQHGLMADETLDTTRIAAARLLGRNAINADPLQALEQASRRRPWNSPPLRTAAASAVNELRRRVRERAQQRAGERSQEAEA